MVSVWGYQYTMVPIYIEICQKPKTQ